MLLVTFSGLDGSGKTTHVVRTAAYLADRGCRVRVLVTANLSVAGLVTLVRHSVKRILQRTRADNHNVSAKPARTHTDTIGRRGRRGRWSRMIGVCRILAYPLDGLIVTGWLHLLEWSGYTAVVCDRYLFDKLVNLTDPTGRLARWMVRVVPRPDLAVWLDVSPDAARSRRPEHEPECYDARHAGYRRLADAGIGLIPIAGTTIDDTQERIERLVDAAIADRPAVPAGAMPQSGRSAECHRGTN